MINSTEFTINYEQLKNLALLANKTFLGDDTSVTIKDNTVTIKSTTDGYETYITYLANKVVAIEDNYSNAKLTKRLVDVITFYKEVDSEEIFLEF